MLLARIKEATLAFHNKREQDLDIFHGLTTLDSYARPLQKFLCFYLPIEPHLLDVQNRYSLQLVIQQRGKSPLLLRDLSDIRMHRLIAHMIPLCETLPKQLAKPLSF